MSTTRVKWGGGVWQPPTGNGKISVKWGGTTWYTPRKMLVKSGAVGAGSWIDTGYTGTPSTPTSPVITSWTFGEATFAWTAGAGGEPIQDYHVYIVKQGYGAVIDERVTGTSKTFGVNWDSTYLCYVSARGINGVETGWADGNGSTINGRVGIGHPQQDTYGYVRRTKAWTSPVQWNYRFQGQLFGWNLSDDYIIQSIDWHNMRSGPNVFHPEWVTFGDRQMYLYLYVNGGQISYNLQSVIENQLNPPQGIAGIASSSSYADYGVTLNTGGGGYSGQGAWWGIYPSGGDWAYSTDGGAGGDNSKAVYCDAVYARGLEWYNNYELTSSVPKQDNYYW